MSKLRVQWIRSGIGHNERQKRTLCALGLRHLQQVVVHEDTSSIRGMIFKVKHLVRVEAGEVSQ